MFWDIPAPPIIAPGILAAVPRLPGEDLFRIEDKGSLRHSKSGLVLMPWWRSSHGQGLEASDKGLGHRTLHGKFACGPVSRGSSGAAQTYPDVACVLAYGEISAVLIVLSGSG